MSRFESVVSRRLPDVLLYLGPIAFCLTVYWYGLWVGYHEDDWVWLGQHRRVTDWASLWSALFEPSRHGTFRPISERLPFLVFGRWFGVDALPFRLLVFSTMFADLVLLTRLMRTLTGSRVAAFSAPVFWVVNASLAVAMTWCCAYMYILCGFLILSAFTLFIRYTETGNRRYYIAQSLIFLFGFLVIETTIVYPAIAAAYALLFARLYLRSTLPMFGCSVLFFLLHTWFIPKQAVGPYSMHFGLSMLTNFATYWQWAVVPWRLPQIKTWGSAVILPAMLALTLALAAYVVCSAWRRRFLPLFFLACFGILLAPVLPLRDHVTDYYLTLPSLALGALGGCALGDAWKARGLWRGGTLALAVLFLAVHWPVSRFSAKWWYLRSKRIENVVLSVMSVRQTEPDKTILLTDVDDAIFLGAVRDRAFAAVGLNEVYLDPTLVRRLPTETLRAAPEEFTLAPALVRHLMDRDRLVVLSAEGERLRKVTRAYSTWFRQSPEAQGWPRRVDLGSQAATALLGTSWHVAEESFRWMPRRASLRLAGPDGPGQRLHLIGHAPVQLTRSGPIRLKAVVDGLPVGEEALTAEGAFRLAFSLPRELQGRTAVEIWLEADRWFTPPEDGRELALIFTVIEIR